MINDRIIKYCAIEYIKNITQRVEIRGALVIPAVEL